MKSARAVLLLLSLSLTLTFTAAIQAGNRIEATAVNSADVSITKTGPSTVRANSLITYRIVVTNAGPGTAASVEMNDVLPAGTGFYSLSTSGGFACTTPQAYEGGTVTCTAASMPVGSATFDLRVAVQNVPEGGITNTATVSSGTADPNGANNAASVTALAPVAVPSLSEWGLLSLVASLLAAAALRIRA